MDAIVTFPKLTPVLLPRPSSQPSPEQAIQNSPTLSRSRSAIPEGSATRIIEPKPGLYPPFGSEGPDFLRSQSLLNPVISALDTDAINIRTASVTPKIKHASRPRTPTPAYSDLGMQKSPEIGRPLNVADALGYLDAVKVQFQDKPDVYNHFLDIMKDFKSQVIDTPGVISRVSSLFHGNPDLIKGFNTFLPLGYRIDISSDPHDPDLITVTTPMGTSTQSTNTLGHAFRHTSETNGFGAANGIPVYMAGVPPPSGGSRPITPHAYHIPHSNPVSDTPYSPGYQGQSTKDAASFLGNLGNTNTVEPHPQGQFNHAILYLNKIKARYSEDSNKYKQFLDILQAYQKEQRHLQDSRVYAQVQNLFKDAPDLLSEFKNFLPDAGVGLGVGVGNLPQQSGVPSLPWNQLDMSDRGTRPGRRVTSHSRRRKRPMDKDPSPARVGPSRNKRSKHHHQSPPFSPYQRQLSPDDHLHSHSHSVQAHHHQSHHSRPLHPAHTSSHQGVRHSSSDELSFFDHAKRALESRDVYDEFLKLLNLFSKDIMDATVLVQAAEVFLGDGDLMAEFRELVGLDDRTGGAENIPPGSIRVGPPDAMSAMPADDGEGPSYRRLPDSDKTLACSGRDQLGRSVLNNEWVSHPAWATEEAGFIAHKKNSFEEVLHKCEEERHEYHVQLEALIRTIAILEPLNARLDGMTADDRVLFKLKPDLGGASKCIYQRVVKKIYGREVGLEVLRALQDCPSVAVPVVLARLKQKDYEWRKAQREWSRTWREVDAKNFYKSLDHQGISFKANDKKNITAKHFMVDIESIKAGQLRVREKENVASRFYGSVGFQLEFSFQDTPVLHDSLKLVYSFLDHSQVQYSPQERRSVERFLRSFIPLLCMYPAAEFNAACGPLDGVQDDSESIGFEGQRSGRRSTGGAHSSGVVASVLRKKLLRTALEKAGGKEGGTMGSRGESPAPGNRPPHVEDVHKGISGQGEAEDIWIRETLVNGSQNPVGSERRPLFANTTFYTLLRLLQSLYSRLLMCREIGAKLAAQKHVSFLENPIALELGLDDSTGPSAVLAQAMEAVGDHTVAQGANVTYMYLLDACEKVFDNELDQATFEEHMRWFFGNKAYHVFTLDKLIAALVKQVQTILSDHKCQEFWFLIQNVRSLERMNNQDIIRYRREAEGIVGVEDPLYKIEWDQESKVMRVQLVGEDDPSVDGDGSALSRWQEYVDTYMMEHPTEWMPREVRTAGRIPVYLRRNTEGERGSLRENDMRIRISFGTYKLFYEAKSEDFLYRKWEKEERDKLLERARSRDEERKKGIDKIVAVLSNNRSN